MAGFQFARMQNFSRKGDKGVRTSDLKLTSPNRAERPTYKQNLPHSPLPVRQTTYIALHNLAR